MASALNIEELQNTAADAIKTYIGRQGIDTSCLTIAFDAATATVTASGEAQDQAKGSRSTRRKTNGYS